MSFRGNQNQNRSRNYGGNMQGGVGGNRMANLSPWGVPNNGGNYGNSAGNMRQGGAGGQGMNAQAINLANNLLSNLFRNQNPPSLLDLPRGGGGGGGSGGNMGNRNRGAGHMMNRGGGGGGNRPHNRRGPGNFPNRGPPGNKPHQKQPMGGGIRKQNSFDRAKKVLAKTNNNNNKNNNKRDAQSMDDGQHEGARESPYANVPNDLFYCHLCKKHMWDALSFENHIKGRTHLMVREGIEESYRLKANMIRQEAKIAEQLKSIELDRLKRMGKSNQRAPEYCTMCDLHFHGHITGHRKSEDHLQLKKFLHPKCNECNEEFSTRIDYDSHLLSAEHLLKAAEKNTKVGERKRNTLTILTADDELKDIRQQQRRRKKVVAAGAAAVKKEGEGDGEEGQGENAQQQDGVDVKQEPLEQAEAEGEAKEGGADETKDDEDLNETHEEGEAAPNDPEDCILDYAEGDEIPVEVETRLPKYNSQRPVGIGLIRKLECYECVLCAKFLDTESTAEVHSRTGGHHRNFLKFINEKASDAKIAQKRATAALEFNERKKRRLEDNEAAKNGSEIKTENKAEVEGEGEGEGEEQTDGNELYNPAEVTGDDDDVEMADEQQQPQQADNDNEAQAEAEAEAEGEGEAEGEEEFIEEKPAEPVIVAAVPVPEPNPEPIPEPVAKPAVVAKTTPVKTAATPNPAATATTPVVNAPAANNSTPEQTPPARKNTAIRGGGSAGRGTPRGRGRGRYNRY